MIISTLVARIYPQKPARTPVRLRRDPRAATPRRPPFTRVVADLSAYCTSAGVALAIAAIVPAPSPALARLSPFPC